LGGGEQTISTDLAGQGHEQAQSPWFWGWTAEEANNACFIVKDANGLAVWYVYFEDEPGRRFDGVSGDA